MDRPRSLVLTVGLVVAACQSSSTTHGSGGAGGGGQGGATTGHGGSATGGASGRGGATTGGTGGGGSMNATEVCQAAVRAQAERIVLCLGLDTLEAYMRYADACPDYAFNPDSNRTVAGLAACLPALEARSCTDIAVGWMPACFVNGKRDRGVPCAFGSQCKQGFCEPHGDGCGVCHDGGIAPGTCSGTFNCDVGTYCNFGTRTCVDNSTMTRAGEGEPCNLDGVPTVGCTGDLYCRTDGGDSAGTCSRAPGAGQACASDGVHLPAAVCAAGTTCAGGICQPTGGCGSGGACSSASYCATGDGGVGCAPRAAVGQSCSATGSVAPPCQAPATCSSIQGSCIVPRAAGEACDSSNPCDKLLMCTGGVCKPPAVASCPA
jgi:hypothetical protein